MSGRVRRLLKHAAAASLLLGHTFTEGASEDKNAHFRERCQLCVYAQGQEEEQKNKPRPHPKG